MAYAIFVGENGNPVTYQLGPSQSFSVESLNATVDTTAMAGGTQTACDAIYEDNAGLLIARSRSSVSLQAGGSVSVTFAPWLPDTFELGNTLEGFVNTTGLCATTLPPGGSVTVQPVDPLAIVRGFRLWVEDAGAGFDDPLTLGAFMLVPGPSATQ